MGQALNSNSISMTATDAIFIVDDDPIAVFGIQRMLQSLYPERPVFTFANGKQALDTVKAALASGHGLPEVIFLDINMPIMDGWQFLEAFIRLPIAIPIRVNIVTSSIDPFDYNQWQHFKSRSRHIIDFRNKPIRREELAAITRAA